MKNVVRNKSTKKYCAPSWLYLQDNKQELCRLNEESCVYFTSQNTTECRALRLTEIVLNVHSTRPVAADFRYFERDRLNCFVCVLK